MDKHPTEDHKKRIKALEPQEDDTTPYLFECTFIDVGQGNCTIIKVYPKPTEFYCWIFDAGSKTYPTYISGNSTSKYVELSFKIIEFIGEPIKLFVVLSHPDQDHLT